jgi:hypothetical protein
MNYDRRHPLTVGDGFRVGVGMFLFQVLLIIVIFVCMFACSVAFGGRTEWVEYWTNPPTALDGRELNR